MAKFELDVNEFHDQFCIRGECSAEVARIIKGIVMCQWMNEPAYKISRNAGAFLQSYNEDLDQSYILVEFWSEDHDAIMGFIDYVNQKIVAM